MLGVDVSSPEFRDVKEDVGADYIRSGKTSLDGIPCEKPDKEVAEGAKISVRGLGKIRLAQIGGRTKKDRISVTIQKYV